MLTNRRGEYALDFLQAASQLLKYAHELADGPVGQAMLVGLKEFRKLILS